MAIRTPITAIRLGTGKSDPMYFQAVKSGGYDYFEIMIGDVMWLVSTKDFVEMIRSPEANFDVAGFYRQISK